MADYTKKNVSELKDSAPEFGMDKFQRGALSRQGARRRGHGFRPPSRQARAAPRLRPQHDEAEEVVFVVAGTGRVKLDDEIVELEPGDFLRISPPVKRRFEADDDVLEMVVFGTRHEGDGDIDPEFWAPDDSKGS